MKHRFAYLAAACLALAAGPRAGVSASIRQTSHPIEQVWLDPKARPRRQ